MDDASFVLKIFVGAIKPMDQLINIVGLNFDQEKTFFEPPYAAHYISAI